MKRRGFTLLELIIVLGILSIVLGMAAMSVITFQERELDHMLEDLRFARTYAVSTQKSVEVVFQVEQNSYLIREYVSKKELLHRALTTVEFLDKPVHIGETLIIRNTGAFSKCGHIRFRYKGQDRYLNFTVGVARFTVTEP